MTFFSHIIFDIKHVLYVYFFIVDCIKFKVIELFQTFQLLVTIN